MKSRELFKKKIIHIYIIVFIISIILLTAGILMLKYYTEGEKNIPFKLTKISNISTAESNLYQSEDGIWHSDIMQNNNMFFTIQKNDNYKKEDAISKIIFTNFNVDKKESIGQTNIYKPSKINNQYTYVDEYIIQDGFVEYQGSQATNSELLQINNQGGVIGFSVATKDLGTYTLNENEKLASDGTLLKKANLKDTDVQIVLTFDLIIETKSGNKFKSNIKIDLPTGNILDDGISKYEDTKLENIIFKRF